MTGTVAYILAKKAVTSALTGIKNIKLQGNQIIFELNDGTQLTTTIPLPKDGVDGKDGKDGLNGKDGKDGLSVTNIEINENNHLICTLSNGQAIDAGELPSGNDNAVASIEITD